MCLHVLLCCCGCCRRHFRFWSEARSGGSCGFLHIERLDHVEPMLVEPEPGCCFTRLSATTLAATMALTPLRAADNEATQRLDAAAVVLSDIMATPDKGIPQDLLQNTHCIVIIPDLKTAAFVVGAKYGKGYLSCRTADGTGWSAPGTVRIEGGSVGFQIGGSSTVGVRRGFSPSVAAKPHRDIAFAFSTRHALSHGSLCLVDGPVVRALCHTQATAPDDNRKQRREQRATAYRRLHSNAFHSRSSRECREILSDA